jgi:hypothetical protein
MPRRGATAELGQIVAGEKTGDVRVESARCWRFEFEQRRCCQRRQVEGAASLNTRARGLILRFIFDIKKI